MTFTVNEAEVSTGADAPQVAASADSTAAPDGVENGQKADDNNHGKSTHFILDFDLTSVSFSDMKERYSADIGGFGLKFGLQKRIAKISSNFDVVGEGLLGFALDYGDVMHPFSEYDASAYAFSFYVGL